jgi:hypothetical protein
MNEMVPSIFVHLGNKTIVVMQRLRRSSACTLSPNHFDPQGHDEDVIGPGGLCAQEPCFDPGHRTVNIPYAKGSVRLDSTRLLWTRNPRRCAEMIPGDGAPSRTSEVSRQHGTDMHLHLPHIH